MHILIGQKAHHMTLHSPHLILVTILFIFALSASKHRIQLVNEVFFIYTKVITPSPGYLKEWRFFKMIAFNLGLKFFLRTRIQGLYESSQGEIRCFRNSEM